MRFVRRVNRGLEQDRVYNGEDKPERGGAEMLFELLDSGAELHVCIDVKSGGWPVYTPYPI